jgi:8-oxo-dGTP diphosphatase
MQETAKVLRVEHNLAWLPQPNESQVMLAPHFPPPELVSTACAVAFSDDRLLMTNLRRRGWDIPGGHVEQGEQPEETVRREVKEEAGATLGALHLLGYQRLRLLGPQPQEYRYPYPDCYQVFYWAHVGSLKDFLPTAETEGCALFTPLEARTLSWVQRHRELYEAALEMATS